MAPKDIRTQLLVNLIQADHQRAISWLEHLQYKVDDEKEVVSNIFIKIDQLPIPQREGLYLICNKMNCASDAVLKEKLAFYIKNHLLSSQ